MDSRRWRDKSEDDGVSRHLSSIGGPTSALRKLGLSESSVRYSTSGRHASDDEMETESVVSEGDAQNSNHRADSTSIFNAAQVIFTDVGREASDVLLLKKALLAGDPEKSRDPFPEKLTERILDTAKHWCMARKECTECFSGRDMDFLFFKFGPLTGTPKRLDLKVTSHDQGWSSYPEDQGTKRNSWTWGEVDVKDSEGVSKLPERERLFTNRHADNRWQKRARSFGTDEGFMQHWKEGDTLEFYFRSRFPGWCIYVKHVSMTLFYDPHFPHPGAS